MNQMIKNTLALFTITAVAGLLLGAVYEGTKEAREEQAVKSQQKAYQSVFEQASEFKEVQIDSVKQALGYSEKEVVLNGAVKALDKDGTLMGYVVTVTAKEGYGGDMKFSVGVDCEQKVTGISYLVLAETAGLGMKAKEEGFVNQYVDGSTGDGESFVVDKDGGDGVMIDAISGATITTRAVTKGVNAACEAVSALLDGGVSNE